MSLVSADQIDSKVIPAQSGELQASNHNQAGAQSGMSKHYSHVKRAKMTTSNSQQTRNVGDNFQLMIDANAMSGGMYFSIGCFIESDGLLRLYDDLSLWQENWWPDALVRISMVNVIWSREKVECMP